ncbi:uncharacterized protein LOC115957014 [Quercus lobata]|uniref:uncharacterized protein LOC115957014 n=1 Tax=Quercus lobata TaxID=97700 RepID=UPI0012442874|nr:uncharacterized protein LOC115957014 [Quercus lobata]
MEKPTATPWPKAEATSSNSSKTIANDVSAEYVSVITGFFKKLGVSHSNSIPDFCNTKYFYSHLIRDAIKPDQVLRGRITCLLTVTPVLANIYGSLHAGAIAAIAEMVSIACARSVVAEDKDIFLGDMSISYLSAAPIHAELIVDVSVLRSGTNLTIVAVEFKLKKTGKLAYTARATFDNMPSAKL